VTFPDRSFPPDSSTLRWVEACLGPGSKVTMVRPLTGGLSHANHALLVQTRGGTAHRLVLRRWTGSEASARLAEYSPEREIAALSLLAACETPTPTLVAADPSGTFCDVPALLITRLLGHPPRPAPDDLPEYLIQFAAALLTIHATAGAASMPVYEPYTRPQDRLTPRGAKRPGLWEHAIDAANRPAPDEPPHFIHRDYHPDNTLWAGGRLTGVIDWTSASYGPVAIDVAHMRWNLAVRYGAPVADRFLDAFDQVSGGYEHDPHWDLQCVVDLLGGDTLLTPAEVAALETYLMGVLDRLGSPTR
jgi:aminoglycoside phosphotransferase (APT) family kinase protein